MDYKFKTPPYAHQTTALEKSWNKKVFAYFMEMGTGKTKVAIDKRVPAVLQVSLRYKSLLLRWQNHLEV